MIKIFDFFKRKKIVKIELTRDSVCMADDVDAPHLKIIEISPLVETTSFIKSIYSNYLPSINGYGHSWDCIFNKKTIATINHMEIIPIILEIEFENINKLFFKYNSSTF